MMKKICFIVALPGTAKSFLSDHIKRLSKHYEVYLVANSRDDALANDLPIVGYHVVDIQRKISLSHDIHALMQLTRYFREMKFDSVHSVTPKAGFLTALAGWLAGIRIRIHIFTGQVWATASGLKRRVLRFIDKIIARLNTHLLVDGEGQRQFLIKESVVSPKKARVLANGSISGVNLNRFVPSKDIREKIRSELGLSDKVVFVFMGRLNRDKGVSELLEAFNRMAPKAPNAFLLLFGSDEANYVAQFGGYENLNQTNFRYYGSTPTPQEHLQAGDVFVLPSYREGFGSSVIEASALGLPVICSDAYGLKDAMVEGETGLRCHVKDIESLYQAMMTLYLDSNLRNTQGENGKTRVKSNFSGEMVGKAWEQFYNELLPIRDNEE